MMHIFGHENWCYFAYQVIAIGFIYAAVFRYRNKMFFPFFMFIWYLRDYITTFDVMRQYMAAGILMFGTDKLDRKQYVRYLLYIVAAFMFHSSALLALPLILATHIVTTSDTVNKNQGVKVIILYGSVILVMFAKPIIFFLINRVQFIPQIYLVYLNSPTYGDVSPGRAGILSAFFYLAAMFFYKRRAEYVLSGAGTYNHNIEFYKFNFIICLAYRFFVRIISTRVLLYSNMFNIFIMAAAPSFFREKHVRFMAYMIILGFTLLGFMIGETIQYKSIL